MASPRRNERGAILILGFIFALLIGGLATALCATAFSYHRSSTEALEHEFAMRAADSGVGYYLAHYVLNQNYFDSNPAPQAPRPIGGGTFTLESAARKYGQGQWELVLQGEHGRGSYRLVAVIGYATIRIPQGISVVGTNRRQDTTFDLFGNSKVLSYDPNVAPLDINAPNQNAGINVNGSASLSGNVTVYGDVAASGNITTAAGANVTGTSTPNGPPTPVEDIDPLVRDLLNSSKTTNQNGALAAIFGSQWTPVSGAENYGDLIINGGTYIVPAGTYRVRRLELHGGAKVIFETSTAPTKLVYVGAGQGNGRLNDLILEGGSSVMVNPGTTTHGLLTVLGPDSDFRLDGRSIYGEPVGGSGKAGYSQIISLGGNTSADEIVVDGASTVYGRLYAAAHQFRLIGGSAWYGSALVRTATIGPATFAVDESSLGTALPDPTDFEVLKRWRAPPQ